MSYNSELGSNILIVKYSYTLKRNNANDIKIAVHSMKIMEKNAYDLKRYYYP